MVLATVTNQAFESSRCRDVRALQRGIEVTHPIPLATDPVKMNNAVLPPQKWRKRTVISLGVDALDALLLHIANLWRESSAGHSKGGEVNLRLPMCVRVMLLKH
jgi:hypothetical protein